jgi:hypothetical protein
MYKSVLTFFGFFITEKDMKNIITLTVLGLFAITLMGCPGGMSTEDFKGAWKSAIDGYYKDVKDGKDMSKVDDLAKRLDAAAKEKKAKDWADLCIQVAKADQDGYAKVVKEMGEYMTKVATESVPTKKDEKKTEEDPAKK